MQVILHHTGFILGVPGEHPPGVYAILDGEIIGYAPLGAESITLSYAAETTIMITGNDESGEMVSETIVSDLSRAPINNGG